MNEYEITFDASYNYDTIKKEADSVLHLISLIAEDYNINRVVSIILRHRK